MNYNISKQENHFKIPYGQIKKLTTGTQSRKGSIQLIKLEVESNLHLSTVSSPPYEHNKEIDHSFSERECAGDKTRSRIKLTSFNFWFSARTRKNSTWLCCVMRTLSAEVMHPEQARQSLRVIWAFCSFVSPPSCFKAWKNRRKSIY